MEDSNFLWSLINFWTFLVLKISDFNLSCSSKSKTKTKKLDLFKNSTYRKKCIQKVRSRLATLRKKMLSLISRLYSIVFKLTYSRFSRFNFHFRKVSDGISVIKTENEWEVNYLYNVWWRFVDFGCNNVFEVTKFGEVDKEFPKVPFHSWP